MSEWKFQFSAILLTAFCELRTAVENVKRNKQRLILLLDRVEWFMANFDRVRTNSTIRPTDLRLIQTFEALLKEIVTFVQLSDSKGWMKRLWRSAGDRDAIDEFNERIDRLRGDLAFVFVSDNNQKLEPLPSAHGVHDCEDFQQILEELNSLDSTIRAEFSQAAVSKEKVVAVVQRKLNESIAGSIRRGQPSMSVMSGTSGGGTSISMSSASTLQSHPSSSHVRTVKPEQFRPNLRGLSKRNTQSSSLAKERLD